MQYLGERFFGGVAMLSYCVTLLAACIGGVGVIDILVARDASAPQIAALASQTCAIVIVPYVFSRCMQGLGASSRSAREAQQLAHLAEEMRSIRSELARRAAS